MTLPSFSIPTLETDRLILRAFDAEDVAHETEFYGSDRAAHMGGPLQPEMVWRVVASMIGHWVMRGFGLWALEDKATGRYAGRAGLWYPEGWPEPEIGWCLMGWAEGRGYAYEAATTARHHAYDTLGWQTAISLIHPENHRSITLAERMGARYEGNFDHVRNGRAHIYRHPSVTDLDKHTGAVAKEIKA